MTCSYIKKIQKIYKVVFLLTLLYIFVPGKAFCFSAMATVDRNTISKNDSVTLKITINGGKGNVDISPITDFKVISRGTGTSVSIINGKYSRKSTHTYLLFPLKQGQLKIPPLTISQGNKIAHTRQIIINVTSADDTPDNTGDIFAQASISSHVLYIGQQAIYTFRFYAAVNCSNANLDQPDFKGFSVKEAGNRKKYTVNINGRLYQVTEINYILTPQKTGKFEIEPAVVICDIPTGRRFNPFGDSFFNDNFFSMGQTKTERVSTKPVKILVKPLPPYNGKGVFSGLVGKFSLGAGLDRTNLKTGGSATLTITISGTGNIKDAIAPAVQIPDGLKSYDDSPEEKVSIGPKGYTGSKIFKKALVPIKPGIFRIKPISLCYFDTQTGKYETISTPCLIMNVKKSNSDENMISRTPANQLNNTRIVKQSVKLTGKDILDLKEGPDVLIQRHEMSFPTFIILMTIPFLAFLIFRCIMLFLKKEKTIGELMEKRASLNLRQAENKDLNNQDFLKYLYTALVSKILAKKGTKGQSLTSEEASDILMSAGYSSDTIQNVSELLSEIESKRYGGNLSDNNGRKELLNKVKSIFKTLCIMLFCLSIFWASPIRLHADQSGTLFLKAIKNYNKGNFIEAAQEFKDIVKSGIKTGALYYNIGNCYFKAGKTGLAILWYERAKKLIPNDPDLKFNLNYANTFVKDKKDNTGVSIEDILFFWKDIIPSSIMEYTAIGFCILFFLYAGFCVVKNKKIFTAAGILLMCCLIISAFSATYDFYYKNTAHFAIIVKNKVAVRSGFSEDSTKLFVLHAGTKVRVERLHGKYIMIFFSKGKIGWVKKGDAEII